MKLMTHKLVSLFALSTISLVAMAMSTTPGTKEEGKALAERGAAHVKKVGYEQALKDFTADQATWGLTTRDKMVYLYVYDYSGKALAHSANAGVVGKELLNIKDPDGKTPIADEVKKAQDGGGYVEFRWASPATKKIARGVAYVIAIPGKDAFIGGHAVLE